MFVDLVYSLRLDVVPLNGAQQDAGIPVYPTSFVFSLMVTSNWDIVDGKNSGQAIDMENLQSLLLLLRFDNTHNWLSNEKKNRLFRVFWGGWNTAQLCADNKQL